MTVLSVFDGHSNPLCMQATQQHLAGALQSGLESIPASNPESIIHVVKESFAKCHEAFAALAKSKIREGEYVNRELDLCEAGLPNMFPRWIVD